MMWRYRSQSPDFRKVSARVLRHNYSCVSESPFWTLATFRAFNANDLPRSLIPFITSSFAIIKYYLFWNYKLPCFFLLILFFQMIFKYEYWERSFGRCWRWPGVGNDNYDELYDPSGNWCDSFLYMFWENIISISINQRIGCCWFRKFSIFLCR